MLVVLAASAVLWATACQPRVVHSGSFTIGVLTHDHDDRYRITDQGAGFTATAPSTNVSSNLRVGVVRDGAPTSVDQFACVTWNGPNDSLIQPGVVLRDGTTAARSRAIMVTDNILFQYRAGFNVHLMDSAAAATPTKVGGAALEGAVGTMYEPKPLPWRLCARVQGTRVEVKAWSIPDHPAEPAWGDATYGFAVSVPSSWVVSGRPGAYVGHLAPGEHARITDLVTQRVASGGS